MAKKSKGEGFNTPFAGLKAAKAAQEQARAKAQESPRAGRHGATQGASKPGGAAPKEQTDRRQEEREAEEFLRAMSDVRRLGDSAPTGPAKRERIEPEKRLQADAPDDEALALAELHSLVSGESPFRMEESEEFLSGSAPGVSHEMVSLLREGKFAFRRHLDLHGYTRDDAKAELSRFIAEARKDGERCVLVVTGRGKSSPDGVSVLREAMPRWLSRYPLRSHVLAFCTARGVDGGPGAFYVLLRRAGVRPFGGTPP